MLKNDWHRREELNNGFPSKTRWNPNTPVAVISGYILNVSVGNYLV